MCCFFTCINANIAQCIVLTRVWAILWRQIQFSWLLFRSFNDLIFRVCVCVLISRLKSIIANSIVFSSVFSYLFEWKLSHRHAEQIKLSNLSRLNRSVHCEKCAIFCRPKEIENNYLSSQLRCMMAHIARCLCWLTSSR